MTRIDRVEARLASTRTSIIEVRAADSSQAGRSVSVDTDLVVVNRLLPTASVSVEPSDHGGGHGRPSTVRIVQAEPAVADLGLFEDPALTEAVRSLLAGSPDIDLDLPPGTGLALLPRCAGGLSELADLVMLTDQAASRSWAEVAPDR